MTTTTKTTKTAAGKAGELLTTQAGGTTREVLQVVAKRDGFRRAGREWHGTTIVPLAELSEEQLRQIAAEPMLVSMLLEVPAEQLGELAGLAATDLASV